MSNDDIKQLLEDNEQKVTRGGRDDLVTILADCLCFGALEPCQECKGQLVYSSLYYYCTGNQTEWTKCTYKTQEPKYKELKINDDFMDKFPFLQQYKYTERKRIFNKEIDSDYSLQKASKRAARAKNTASSSSSTANKQSTDTMTKVKVKGGLSVDPDSGLENEAHVVKTQDGSSDPFSVVLGLGRLNMKINS